MAPKKWDDEDDSTPPSSPPQPPAIERRAKFDDEEDDSDVADNWEEAEDSEVEREKAKKAAEAKAKADAEAAKNKKTKAQRIEERRMENMRKKLDAEDLEDESSEDETDRRARLRRTEQAADLKHAEDLFGGLGPKKKAVNKAVITIDPNDPSKSVDLASLPLFNPSSKEDFAQLRDILGPILNSNARKAQYTLFMQEFAKDILRDLPSDQIKKIGSSITTLSNEKLKEEKAADKTGKKTKAAKTKATLVANRDTAKADTTSYADFDLDDNDFM